MVRNLKSSGRCAASCLGLLVMMAGCEGPADATLQQDVGAGTDAIEDVAEPVAPVYCESEARQVYAPTSIVVEPQRAFDTRSFDRPRQNRTVQRRGETRIPNTLSMFFGIWSANQLKRAHEAAGGFVYDLVIRCRTDLFFFEPIGLSRIEKERGARVVVPSHGGDLTGVNDQLALGPSAQMDAYCETYDRIPDYYAAGGHFHPETMLLACLRERGLEPVRHDMAFEIVRGEWPSPEAYADAVRRGEGADPKRIR